MLQRPSRVSSHVYLCTVDLVTNMHEPEQGLDSRVHSPPAPRRSLYCVNQMFEKIFLFPCYIVSVVMTKNPTCCLTKFTVWRVESQFSDKSVICHVLSPEC